MLPARSLAYQGEDVSEQISELGHTDLIGPGFNLFVRQKAPHW